MTQSIVPASRPRNPLVAAALFRRAGRHGAPADASRPAARQALSRELARLDLPRAERGRPPHP